MTRPMRRLLLATTVLATVMPATAFAQTGAAQRQAALEKRLEELESAVSELRSELAAARAEAESARTEAQTAVQANQAAQSTTSQTAEKVAKLEAKAAEPPPDGFRVGGTTVKINGFIKLWTSYTSLGNGGLAGGALGRDFYLPSQIPVGGESTDFLEAHAKQTRVWLTTSTPLGDDTVNSHLELDFQTSPGTQGSQRTTNGYNAALRRAFLSYKGFVFGQDWSNFQYVAALPETTDFIGPTEGTVFVRQAQIRYGRKLGDGLSFAVSVENPATAEITSASPALVESTDDQVPDFVGRVTLTRPFGEISLAGVIRQLKANVPGGDANATGWGLSLAGKLPLVPGGRHDVRFMFTHGEGIGRYVGLNFAPDALFTAAGDLQAVQLTAGFAAVKLGWTDKLRSTFMGSFQDVVYPSFAPLTANSSAWSVAGNLFYSPVKNIDLGLEYRHGERALVSGDTGDINRVEFAARYNF